MTSALPLLALSFINIVDTMRNLLIYLSALSSLSGSSAVRHGAAQLRDLLAYPKYNVQFLNELPLSSSDADRAKSFGVEREDEWLSLRLGQGRERLSDGSDSDSVPSQDRLQLIPMSLTPPGAPMQADYLCLMPPSDATSDQTAQLNLEEHVELDPVQSWAALSHLDGKCLYSKQGWFTYSYCHNSHIRQFREARHRHPHPPGGHEPEEDTSHEAYTLGQAQQQVQRTSKSPAKSNTNANTNTNTKRKVKNQAKTGANTPDPKSPAPASPALDQTPSISNPSVSFAESASSRYLVQRWSDGTTCDKTGLPREIEVQVHCSMTTTDVIYLVKEMAICQYVLIIHSPHLCGLPGFRAPHADVVPAGIRCRQIIADADFEGWAQRSMEREREEGRAEERLGLPWQLTRPVGGIQGVQPSNGEEGAGANPAKKVEGEGADAGEVYEYEIDDLDLQQFLVDALSEYGTGENEQEEFMLLSLEADEEGNYVVDTDLLGGEGDSGKVIKGDDREMLLKAVKRYLETKPEIKREAEEEQGESPSGERRQRDEL